jgi:hypothetical protein
LRRSKVSVATYCSRRRQAYLRLRILRGIPIPEYHNQAAGLFGH